MKSKIDRVFSLPLTTGSWRLLSSLFAHTRTVFSNTYATTTVHVRVPLEPAYLFAGSFIPENRKLYQENNAIENELFWITLSTELQNGKCVC